MSHQNKTCAILVKNIMGNIYIDLILNLDQWSGHSRFKSIYSSGGQSMFRAWSRTVCAIL